MKTIRPSKKRGSTLVIVMIILVAFSLMTVALLQLGSFSEMETIKQLRTAQAHWLAEAGLERALSWVFASAHYRNGSFPDDFLNDEVLLNGTGSYAVEIDKTPVSTVVNQYTIESTGTVSNNAMNIEATVRYTIEAAPGIHQGLLALGGDSTLKNPTIIGDVYQAYPGTITFSEGSKADSIHGTIEAEGGLINPPSGLDVGDLPDPDPGPWVDPADYTDPGQPLDIASSTNPVVAIQGVYSGPFDLSGDTIYVNGNVTIDKDSPVPDGKTVVASGTVTFGIGKDSVQEIGDNAVIIAGGNIGVDGSNIEFGENAQLITMTDFYLSNNQDYPNPGVGIIAIGNVNVEANMTGFQGIIYAGGKVTFNDGTQDLEGAVIAWDGFDLGANSSITYNPDVFADPNPIDYGDSLALLSGVWQEL